MWWLVLLVCVTAGAVKQRDFTELEVMDSAVCCYFLVISMFNFFCNMWWLVLLVCVTAGAVNQRDSLQPEDLDHVASFHKTC
jgi:predicted secreted protein